MTKTQAATLCAKDRFAATLISAAQRALAEGHTSEQRKRAAVVVDKALEDGELRLTSKSTDDLYVAALAVLLGLHELELERESQLP